MVAFSELFAAVRSDEDYRLALHNSESAYDLVFSLVQARKDAGLKQPDVAETMGISQQAVSKIESMEGDPRLSTLRRYANAIGVHLDLKIAPSAPNNTVVWDGSVMQVSTRSADEAKTHSYTPETATRAHFTIAA